MQKTLVAQSKFPYRQKMLEAGEEFEPENESDAYILRLSGKAMDKLEDDDASKKRSYRRRDMKAEQ
jgi:hypothetical protein